MPKEAAPQTPSTSAHECFLLLKDDGSLPGGIWQWEVYVDGNVHSRGPGSTRKDPLKYYALLAPGIHRIVIREPDHTKSNRIESNTLSFSVDTQAEIIISVTFRNGNPEIAFENSG